MEMYGWVMLEKCVKFTQAMNWVWDCKSWHDALQKGLIIPEGKYLLADAGFPTSQKCLTLYHGVQYHLAEWGHAQLRYEFIFEFNPLINSE